MSSTRVIALTGLIGSGKSVVCHILNAMGHTVYDCDSRAKLLMDTRADIRTNLARSFGNNVINSDGTIDRAYLGEIVFNDEVALNTLNGIVHDAVRRDLAQHIDYACNRGDKLFFFETAILAEARLDSIVDAVWLVTCPDDVRIERIMTRNSMTAAQARARINSQQGWPEENADVIINDGAVPVLPRVMQLLTQV